MQALIKFLSNTLGKELATVLSSMVPLIELKGSIMFARGAGLNFFLAFLYSFLGSTAMFFVIFFLLIPVLNLLKKLKFFRSFANGVENYFKVKAKSEIDKRKDGKFTADKIKMLTVFIFVAIPLPMTGVWTGTALAVFLRLKFKQAVLPVAVGNLIAGLIISVLAELFLDYVDIILWVLLALAIILLIIFIVKVAKKSSTKNDGVVEFNNTVNGENAPMGE